MIIQHNIMALNAHRQLGGNNNMVSKNLEKLSSGYRINRAGDDAAGLAISEKMRAQIKGLEVAQSNAQDGISLIQTAEGALTEVHSMLNRMVELAQQSANGTIDDSVDRAAIQAEVDALNSEIDRIASSTNFNGISLLDGSLKTGSTTTYSYDTAIDATNAANISNVVIAGSADAEDLATPVELTFEIDYTHTGSTVAVSMTDNSGDTYTFTENATPANTGVAGSITFAIAGAGGTEPLHGATVTFDFGSFDVTQDSTVTSTITLSRDSATTANGLTLQVGDSNEAFQKVSVNIDDMTTTGLSLSGLSVANQTDAAAAINTIKTAINSVSSNRGTLGALQNRLEHTINNLAVSEENMTAAESRIRDVDMAKEMMEFTKNNVLTQAAQAMLAQANQQPQSVLQLLR